MEFLSNGSNGKWRTRVRRAGICGAAALALSSAAIARPPAGIRADLNGDNRIDRVDVVILLEAMLASVSATTPAAYQTQVARADVNNDRRLSTIDVQAMLNAMGAAGATINIPAIIQQVGAPNNFLSQMMRPPPPPTGGGSGGSGGGGGSVPPGGGGGGSVPPGGGGGGSVPPGGGGGGSVPPGGAGGGSVPPAGGVAPSSDYLGMNLAPLSYFTRQWMFVDVMKIAAPWYTLNQVYRPGSPTNGSSNLQSAFNWDANGYPTKVPVAPAGVEPQVVETLIYRDVSGKYPGGNYVCLYDGQGEILFRGDATVISQTPGRMVVKVVPTNVGIMLRINRSVEGNHIRNIRLIMPGFEQNYAQQVFHPTFLDRLRPFKTLRFMEMMRTNGSTQKDWEDRPLPNFFTQGLNKGVALEYQIDLCNRLDANPWFTIPHLATDEYIREFARVVKSRLRPGLKVYLEWSNEVWNGAFPQSQYAGQQGVALNLAPDPGLAKIAFYSKRSGETFRIFEQVFGGSQRLVRILGSQHANAWVSRKALETFVARFGANKVDAIAVAPYFGGELGAPQTQNTIANLSVSQLLNRLEDSLNASHQKTVAQADVARQFNVRLMSYEAGQHLVGVGGAENNNALTNLFIAVNRHPGMADLLRRQQIRWHELGGHEYVAFSFLNTYNKWGAWGYIEEQDQPLETAHKYRALVETAAAGN